MTECTIFDKTFVKFWLRSFGVRNAARAAIIDKMWPPNLT